MKHSAPIRRGDHAIVIGGSMAGLLAARVLMEHYDRVTILERDRFPDTPEARKGVPQARHIHVLLTAGRRIIERLLPGVLPGLIAAGAEDYDALQDAEWLTPAGLGVRCPSNLRFLGATRDLIDWTVRRHVLAEDRIKVRQEVDVKSLRVAEGRVIGVTVEDRSTSTKALEPLDGDLVIDGSGRGTRTPQWLEALGYPRPRETVVNGFLGYSSRLVRPPTGSTHNWKMFYIQCAPPFRRRGGVIASVEGGRWVVTLVGGGKDYPPTDEDAFRDFARSLADPRFAAAYEAAEPLTPIVGTKTTENRLRHYEELPRRLEGYLVIGDAACAFNPVYGQGMSTAALGAETLEACLRASPAATLAGLPERFQSNLAKANTRAWLLATGEDYRYQEVEGPPPAWSAKIAHRYFDRVMLLTTRNPGIRLKFMEVLHLIRSPASLFTPDVLARAAFVRP